MHFKVTYGPSLASITQKVKSYKRLQLDDLFSCTYLCAEEHFPLIYHSFTPKDYLNSKHLLQSLASPTFLHNSNLLTGIIAPMHARKICGICVNFNLLQLQEYAFIR